MRLLTLVIIVLTSGALRIVKVVLVTALGADALRESFFALLLIGGGVKFKLLTFGTDVDIHLKRSREQIWQISEKQSCFSELNALVTYVVHLCAAA